jgi:plasmid stabilization system protein ParE
MRDALFWIDQHNPRAAAGLPDAVRHAAKRIGEFPQIGERRRELAPEVFRFLVIPVFDYRMIIWRAEGLPRARIMRIPKASGLSRRSWQAWPASNGRAE